MTGTLDRALRLRADGRQAVAEALGREVGGAPVKGRLGRGGRWHMLHGIDMAVGSETVQLDHLVIGPPGVFVLEVRHQPGAKVHASTTGLEVDGVHVDLARMRTLGEEVHDRLAEAIALAAGFEEVLDPPAGDAGDRVRQRDDRLPQPPPRGDRRAGGRPRPRDAHPRRPAVRGRRRGDLRGGPPLDHVDVVTPR